MWNGSIALLLALGGCRSTRIIGTPPEEVVDPPPTRTDANTSTDARRDTSTTRPEEVCDPVDTENCTVRETLVIATDSGREVKPVGIASIGDRIAVVYSHRAPQTMMKNLFMTILNADDAPRTVQITDVIATDSEPAIVASGDNFVVAWKSTFNNDIANTPDNIEIYVRAFDTNGQPAGSLQRVTRDREGALHADGEPTLASNGSELLLHWIQADPIPGAPRVPFVTRLGLDGTPSGNIARLSIPNDRVMTRPSFAATADGYNIYWPDSYGAPGQAYMGQLQGSAVMNVTAISRAGSTSEPGATVRSGALAIDAAEGVFIYDVVNMGRREVRGRRLTPAGQLNIERPDEGRVLATGETGWDASATRYSGGYVIAQRYTSATSPVPFVRATFVQSNFNVVRQMPLAQVSDSGSQVQVRAVGRRVVAAWVDAYADRTDVRVSRLSCGIQ